VNDADMLGTSLFGYAKNVINEVVGVGRAGTLVDWEGDFENRVYASLYTAEQISNWRVERVNGRSIPVLVVLRECAKPHGVESGDEFVQPEVEQIRVLKLVPSEAQRVDGGQSMHCVVEIWQPKEAKRKSDKLEWQLVETRTPLRLPMAVERLTVCAGAP
jgi:hypothetical protein